MTSLALDSRLGGAVGGKTAAALERAFGMATVGDLLLHYPRRYARRGELTQISSLPVGEAVTIVAEVKRVNERRMKNRNGSLGLAALSFDSRTGYIRDRGLFER